MEKQKQIEESSVGSAVSRQPEKFKFTIRFFNKILFLSVAIFGISYLLCINDLAIKGFKLNELKTEYNKLNNENNKYELEIMSYKSYNNLSQRAKNLNLTLASAPEYIDAGLTTVAANK